jgi:hypothetical protein
MKVGVYARGNSSGRRLVRRAGVELQRHPHLRLIVRQVELRRRHADDRDRHRAEADARADHTRVTVEALPPKGVAEHRHRGGVRPVVGVGEASSEERPCADHLEEVSAHGRGTNALGGIRRDETGFALVVERDVLESLRVLAEEEVPRLGHPPLRVRLDARHRVLDVDEARGVRVGEGSQHHGVEQSIDGGRRPDAQAERQHHDRGKCGAKQETAECLSEIARQGAAPLPELVPSVRSGIDLLQLMANDRHVTEPFGHLTLRLFSRQARRDQLLDPAFDVEAELAIDVAAEPSVRRRQTKEPGPLTFASVVHRAPCAAMRRFTASV